MRRQNAGFLLWEGTVPHLRVKWLKGFSPQQWRSKEMRNLPRELESWAQSHTGQKRKDNSVQHGVLDWDAGMERSITGVICKM